MRFAAGLFPRSQVYREVVGVSIRVYLKTFLVDSKDPMDSRLDLRAKKPLDLSCFKEIMLKTRGNCFLLLSS